MSFVRIVSPSFRKIYKKKYGHFLDNRKRDYWQIVVAGVTVFLASKVAEYSFQILNPRGRYETTASGSKIDESHVPEEHVDAKQSQGSSIQKDENYQPEKSKSAKTDTEVKATPNTQPKISLNQVLGVDIGTSLARISYRNQESTAAILENREGKRHTSTTLHIHDSQINVGSSVTKARWIKPNQVAYGTQLMVGLEGGGEDFEKIVKSLPYPPKFREDSEPQYTFGADTVTPSECMSAIVKELVSVAKDKVPVQGTTVTTSKSKAKKRRSTSMATPAILSVPVCFTPKQINIALSAAREGGLNCVGAVPDPVAAFLGAMALGEVSVPSTGSILVVDFGGRVVQTSLLTFPVTSDSQGPIPCPQIMSSVCSFDVGSEFINDILVRHLVETFARSHGINLLSDVLAVERLNDAAEACKLELSGAFSSSILLPYITANAEGPIHLERTISRAHFDVLVSPLIDRLKVPIHSLLVDAKKTTPISAALLVGGGARIPVVKSAVSSIVDAPVITGLTPEEVVCIGAAHYSTYLR